MGWKSMLTRSGSASTARTCAGVTSQPPLWGPREPWDGAATSGRSSPRQNDLRPSRQGLMRGGGPDRRGHLGRHRHKPVDLPRVIGDLLEQVLEGTAGELGRAVRDDLTAG